MSIVGALLVAGGLGLSIASGRIDDDATFLSAVVLGPAIGLTGVALLGQGGILRRHTDRLPERRRRLAGWLLFAAAHPPLIGGALMVAVFGAVGTAILLPGAVLAAAGIGLLLHASLMRQASLAVGPGILRVTW